MEPDRSPPTGTFASLRHPNFRLWFSGQLVSLFGTWMQVTAMGFYAYQITGSKAFLGSVAFAAGIPTIFFMFAGGLAADHLPRRRLLLITQTSLMILALSLAALTFLNLTTRALLIIIAVLNGVTNAFDAPARQSFILEMVDRPTLSNAIALNSTMFNIATALGPALGGALYALLGPAVCFLVNGISFLAVILALSFMRLPPSRPAAAAGLRSPLRGIFRGFRYILSEPHIRSVILAAAVVSFLGFSVFALFPAWAVEMLHGDETTNGFLQSARGLGALASALLIASAGNFPRRGRWMISGMFIFSLALIAFSFVTLPLASFALALAAGAGMMIVFNLANSMIQSRVKDEYRGRVMSVYSLTFFGVAPAGSLLLGVIADLPGVGAQRVVFGSAALLLVFAVGVLAVSKKVRGE